MVDTPILMLSILGSLFAILWFSKLKDKKIFMASIMLGIVHIALHIFGFNYVFPDDPVKNYAIFVTIGLIVYYYIREKRVFK